MLKFGALLITPAIVLVAQAPTGVPASSPEAERIYQDARTTYMEKRDVAGAIILYKRAAELGHPMAMNALGHFYTKGEGVPQSDEIGYKYYRKAAELGYRVAQTCVGYCLVEGQGVQLDAKEALVWFVKAADQGDSEGLMMAGKLLWSAKQVIPQDFPRAYSYMKKSVELDNQEAMFYLGVMIINGHGTARNREQGMAWIKKAAKNGDTQAIQFLNQSGQ